MATDFTTTHDTADHDEIVALFMQAIAGKSREEIEEIKRAVESAVEGKGDASATRNEKLAKAYLDLEYRLGDVHDALNLLEHVQEQFFGTDDGFMVERVKKQIPELRGYKILVLTPDNARALATASSHLGEEVQKLYEAYHDEPVGESEEAS
jgi:hypothetical protein